MYAHSLHHGGLFHRIEQYLTTLDQQTIAAATLIMALLFGLGYVFSLPPESVEMSQTNDVPVSRFVDPQYAHEVAMREQAVVTELEMLRDSLQAERAYLAVYSDLSGADGIEMEQQVSRILEVTKAGAAPTMQQFQGLSRVNWLQAEDNAHWRNWFLPQAYGFELYNARKTPIGYIGLEKIQENLLDVRGFELLEQARETIAAALDAPL